MSGGGTAASSHRTASDSAPAWSRYWARGALHSCPNAFEGNYGGEIRALWVAFFSALPRKARILDIGTGNGAVALIARDAARERGHAHYIEAIDAADIDPRTAAAHHGLGTSGIVFRGRTRCEHTGCPAASFDAVTGQYALEYSSIEETAAELCRILRPGGRGLFVIHHVDSPMLSAGREQLDGFAYLRQEAPIISEARRRVGKITCSYRPVSGGRALLALQRDVARVAELARQRPQLIFLEGIAAQVAAALTEAARGDSDMALQRLNVLSAEASAHEQRLSSMVRAAHTRESLERLAATLRATGLATDEAAELRSGEDVLGWVLGARRRAAAP